MCNHRIKHKAHFWEKGHYDNDKTIYRILQGIPPTVESLIINNLLPKLSPSVFSTLGHTITYLSLRNTGIDKFDAQSILNFARGLPRNIVTLNLTANSLNQITPNELTLFLSSLSSMQSLQKLGLRENRLCSFKPNILANIFSTLPFTLNELDLADNNLLLLDEDSFSIVLARLAYSIKSGGINCLDDLKYEFELIKPANHEGTLASLYSFLVHRKPKPAIECHEEPGLNCSCLG